MDLRAMAATLREVADDSVEPGIAAVMLDAARMLDDAAWGRDAAITLLADYRSTDCLADAANYLQESFEITEEEIEGTLADREEDDDD